MVELSNRGRIAVALAGVAVIGAIIFTPVVLKITKNDLKAKAPVTEIIQGGTEEQKGPVFQFFSSEVSAWRPSNRSLQQVASNATQKGELENMELREALKVSNGLKSATQKVLDGSVDALTTCLEGELTLRKELVKLKAQQREGCCQCPTGVTSANEVGN